MAKKARTRLDRKALAGLGVDRLVEILLDEAASSKTLKARLETALAAAAGPEETALAIDRILDAHEKAKTRINRPRARDLASELSGIVRTIQKELGEAAPRAAIDRLMRFRALRARFEDRLNAESARLMNTFAEAEVAVEALLPALLPKEQVSLVADLEAARRKDRYVEHFDFFAGALSALAAEAARAWQDLLETRIAAGEPGHYAQRLLQRLYHERGDLDGFIRLETTREANRQDTLLVARKLHSAGRNEEALDWVRKVVAGKRYLVVNGISVTVGPDYERAQRKLLEADILEALKERETAQALRWQVFSETFDRAVLALYISRLDDFAEFDELDRAFALVSGSDRGIEALMFFIEWPKLDRAAEYVTAHPKAWERQDPDLILTAADALSTDFPLASTILYRALVAHVLDRAVVGFYTKAAAGLSVLERLATRLEYETAIEPHARYLARLQAMHQRKLAFWQMAASIER